MSETTMAQALKKAGVKPAAERLKDIALVAMVAHADDTMAAIEQVWKAIQKDCDLLIALFDQWDEHKRAIGRIFHQLKHDIAVEQQRGAKLDPRQRKIMEIIKRESEERRREEEESRAAARAEQSRHDREYKEYLASWHKTPLFDVTIGTKHIWQVSAGTVRAWLPTQKRKLRAIEMLIEGIPDDGRPIEFYRTPTDIMEIWKILGDDESEC